MDFGSFSIDTASLGAPATALVQTADKSGRERMIRTLLHKIREQRATFDAARSSPDFDNYWANADAFDADSAHSRGVRHTLVRRSRYELANNGYADGIAQTYATDLVGIGPKLRMQTSSKNFNQMVQREWYAWCKATQFRRKFWCMAHAKHGDGEGLGVMRRNPRVKHPIPLDVVLYETEQCQSSYETIGVPGYIDGIKFDDFGNPEWYDILHQHPGTSHVIGLDMQPEQVPADRVLHWYKLRRPGQHRGIPECASTLNLGAAFRRFREANLLTAEKVAAWTLMLKSLLTPEDGEEILAEAMSTLEIVHGMMTALPLQTEPVQLKAEHPGPQYGEFHDKLLSEQARPKNMPRNKAGCDSSSYNYASGRLDHQTYYANLDVDREDGDDQVLDPLFNVWFDLAINRFGWLGGNPEAVGYGARVHMWDWPKHPVADVESEANANQTKLASGQAFLHRIATEEGYDVDEEIAKAVETYGVDETVLRRRLFDVTLPPPKSAATGGPSPSQLAGAILSRLNGHARNLPGATHAN